MPAPPAGARVRVGYSDHLVTLIAQGEAAATRLAAADPDSRAEVTRAARRESARLSARLDASPLRDDTAAAVDAREHDGAAAVLTPAPGVVGGWAAALRLEGVPTQELAAVEYANLLACFDAEPALAGSFFERPLDALSELHAVVCRGLVDAGAVGRPRRTERAVHEGAQGRIIYRAADPADLSDLLAGLAAWLGRGSAAMPSLAVAGVVQERLLQWQPYEAANGRVARAASRLVLRARGLDPDGAAVCERLLAADPVGYHGEVAATIRRRGDVGGWLERYCEAAAAALTEAADEAAGGRPPAPPARGAAVCAGVAPGESLTVTEYARRAGVTLETAREDLRMLARAGAVSPVPRSRGLRYRRADA
ncbi:MAG: Fic family protein [Actinobacteria bacterium]|nr:Fic family protein [Actinomycetota bacterium]